MTTADGPVTSLLDLRLRAEVLDDALDVVERTLRDTRARPGCLGADVMVDVGDPAHVVAVERWESLEHDDAYRAWRLTPDGASDLARVLAAPPVLTRLTHAPGQNA